MNVNVYQHFRKEEHPFVDFVYGSLEQVDSQYSPYLTDFLDPRQQFILETIVRNREEFRFSLFGGYPDAERKRALIYPDYFEVKEEDFDVSLYQVKYPLKFTELSHGKILGTLIGTGITREHFGDIITDGEQWQILMDEKIASYVELQMDKIGKVSVRLEKLTALDRLNPTNDWETEVNTFSSLRVDTVISTLFNISRQRAKTLIESGKVKINWTETTRPDSLLAIKDMISVRGFGRIQLVEFLGETKKEKLRIEVSIIRK